MYLFIFTRSCIYRQLLFFIFVAYLQPDVYNYYKLVIVSISYKSAHFYVSFNARVFPHLIKDHAVSTYMGMEV
jgi:hypothetical protein